MEKDAEKAQNGATAFFLPVVDGRTSMFRGKKPNGTKSFCPTRKSLTSTGQMAASSTGTIGGFHGNSFLFAILVAAPLWSGVATHRGVLVTLLN